MEGEVTSMPSSEQVRRLLGLPPPHFERWDGYRDLGIAEEHVPELIVILKDQARPGPDWSDEVRFWPLVHSWRAIGELKSAHAVPALLEAAQRLQSMPGGDEWSQEELPTVFGMIGADAIDPLTTFLADQTMNGWARDVAAAGLREIARNDSAHRGRCIAIIAAELDKPTDDSDADDAFDGGGLDLPTMLVSHLLDLKAVEAVPQLKRAYHAGRIDEAMVGHWGDVRRELDLPAADDDPPWEPRPRLLLGRGLDLFEQQRRKQAKDKAKARVERKQARKARKQNRRRR